MQPEPLQCGQGPGRSWDFSWFPRDTAAAQGPYNPQPQAVADRAVPKSSGGAQPVGQHKAALGKGTDRPLWGLLPDPTGVHRASALAIGGALPRGAELHLLSGTRTSQGNGMVGLLSLMSITTTVSVAEPTRGGVPLSIAVTTKLWASTRAQHKVHRQVAICVREQCTYAQHLEHVGGYCTCAQGWSVYMWQWNCAQHLECLGQWIRAEHLDCMCGAVDVCTSRVWWGRAADGCTSDMRVWRALSLCAAPGTYEQAVNVGTSVWSMWWAVGSCTALAWAHAPKMHASLEALARGGSGCTHSIFSLCKGQESGMRVGDDAGRTYCGVQGDKHLEHIWVLENAWSIFVEW